MPRHPPCALHSLSQQRQNNTRQNKHIRHTNPPPNQRGEPATHNSTQPARNQPATPITSTTTNPPNAPPDKQGEHPKKSSGREDARVHYADLKQQPHQHPTPTTGKPAHVDAGQREDMKHQPNG